MDGFDTSTFPEILEQALHRHIVQAYRGLLPATINPYTLKQVLDIYCKSGVWAIDLSRSYPSLRITGMESNVEYLEEARRKAEIGKLTQMRFYEFHPGRPFPVSDQTYDFVRMFRLTQPFLPAEWTFFLQECMRVMKVGSSINLVCLSLGPGSGAAYPRIILLLEQLAHTLGYSFSGQPGTIGPGVFLCHLLRKAGFANVAYSIAPVNFGGWSNSLGRLSFQLLLRSFYTIKPLFLQYQLIDDQAFEDLIKQQRRETESLHFCAVGALISTLAEKK